jgi:hypothetical protein
MADNRETIGRETPEELKRIRKLRNYSKGGKKGRRNKRKQAWANAKTQA